MGSEMDTVEERLKSFASQLRTESGIFERIVYKHKNQHRRSSYFQYILKVRRDLNLLKSANLEEVLDSCFTVINGNKPKQKLLLLESLKKKRGGRFKYNFLERLLGVTRLLSEMVEPILKAAMEISTLLAQSFFMKFSVTILAVLGRIRVLVQQMLLDAVLMYNTASSLSQKEHEFKLNRDGFEVFREYFPRKEAAIMKLECVWVTDKYVLVEKTHETDITLQSTDDRGGISSTKPKIAYNSIDFFLGVGESGNVAFDPASADLCSLSQEDSLKKSNEAQIEAGPCIHSETLGKASVSMDGNSPSFHAKKGVKKKVAFVAVKPPTPSTRSESLLSSGDMEKKEEGKEDTFFNLLTSGMKRKKLL